MKRALVVTTGGMLALAAGGVVWVASLRGGPGEQDATASQARGTPAAMGGMPGMDMSALAGGSITLTNSDVAGFGVTFGSAEVRRLEREVRVVGLVAVDETRVSYVSARFGGWAERLYVDFEGQAVRAGEPLLDVYAPELVLAQEELLVAADMRRFAGAELLQLVADDLFAAPRRRLENWNISGDQIERVLADGEARRALTLYAPASGVVTEKRVYAGESFEVGATLYVIADLSRVWVNAEVFEGDASLMRAGAPADISVAGLERRFSGRVGYVYPTLDENTRSLRVRVSVPNDGGLLRPGMYATVRIRAEIGRVLTVPVSAVLHSGERSIVFIDMGEGRLLPQEIEVGVRGGDFVEVLSGVEPGQRVATSAHFLLDSEANLAEVVRAMMAQMSLSDIGER